MKKTTVEIQLEFTLTDD